MAIIATMRTKGDTNFRKNIWLKNRKFAKNVLCTVMGFFFLACGHENLGERSADASINNTLRFDVNAPLDSFDPMTTATSGSTLTFPLIFSYLFVPNVDGTLEPDLAISWDYDAKTQTWTIFLRDDARFHDGRPVTSRDAVKSIDRLAEKLRASLRSIIKEMHIVDSYQFEIILNRNDPGFLKSICDIEISPRFVRNEDKKNKVYPIGSGPFMFKENAEWNQVVLEANPNYYNGRPAIDRIIFYYEADKEKSWTRLISGETDIAYEISAKNFNIIQQYEGQFHFNQVITSQYTLLLFNTFDPLFSDPNVRRALSCAIDRQHIIDQILKGYGIIAKSPMGEGSPYQNPAIEPIPYDPKRAITLLKEAGWLDSQDDGYLRKEGNCFKFTLLFFQESQMGEKVARYIQLCFSDIGIQVQLEAQPFEDLLENYHGKTDFQAVLTEMAGIYKEPERLGIIWCSDKDRKAMAGCFSNKETNKLMSRIVREKDAMTQKALLMQFDELITSFQPAAFLFQNVALDVMSKRVQLPVPFSLDHEGVYRLQYAVLKTS